VMGVQEMGRLMAKGRTSPIPTACALTSMCRTAWFRWMSRPPKLPIPRRTRKTQRTWSRSRPRPRGNSPQTRAEMGCARRVSRRASHALRTAARAARTVLATTGRRVAPAPLTVGRAAGTACATVKRPAQPARRTAAAPSAVKSAWRISVRSRAVPAKSAEMTGAAGRAAPAPPGRAARRASARLCVGTSCAAAGKTTATVGLIARGDVRAVARGECASWGRPTRSAGKTEALARTAPPAGRSARTGSATRSKHGEILRLV
jgi:hypothetical protein